MLVRKFIASVFVFSCVLVQLSMGQEIRQTVRGKIIDEDSRTPLPGANVRVAGTSDVLGASTDVDGTFRIPNVPVGRITLVVSFVGYEDRVLPNILVTSGKETVVEIPLKESLIMMDAIVVNGNGDKSEISNEMALTSARAFTVEETKRYAGSWNDPARMVSAYAGVDSDPAGDNFIIVRGNSPKGIQWRLEGIDIPNPNHFSDEGMTGGQINALNSSMLTNADFYTGAFAPEFGNALSGVFDMKLRKGNNEKREYSVSVGILGTDATVEGPFSKNSDASYLINYRYSTLSMLDGLGLVDFDGVPKYQDMSFKFHLPTRSLGTFSIFGVGGKSNIKEEEFDDDDEERLLEEGNYKSHMGVVGVTQYLPLGSNTFLQNSVSVSQNGSGYLGFEPDEVARLLMVNDFELKKKTLKGASTLTHKFNARHTVQSGLIYTRNSFDFYSLYLDEETGQYVNELNQEGKADQYQGFVSWKFRPWQSLSVVGGAHIQGFSINNAVAVEPRVSMRWQFAPAQALTAGFGIHGKMETLTNYYAIIPDENGSPEMPNLGLGFTKARHYVVGYENKLSQNLFLKAEAYYQQLYDVPVENDPTSSYSLLNQVDGLTDRRLVNRGTGRNMGVELTLERYFADNYYFMITSSLFDSKYKALDGVERNTLFNGQIIGNVLAGKEFHLNTRSSKKKVLGVNTKLTSMGGRRFTPINLEESIARHRTVFYEDRAFSERGDNVFILNLAISYRIDNRRISQELKLDLQNMTNNAATLGYYYDENTGKIKSFDQLPLLPVLFYTVSF